MLQTSTKSKEQAQADQRRDDLAKRVLKMPPAPKKEAIQSKGKPKIDGRDG